MRRGKARTRAVEIRLRPGEEHIRQNEEEQRKEATAKALSSNSKQALSRPYPYCDGNTALQLHLCQILRLALS